ncbi:recombinase family protein [Hyphococcus sp.]|uniref:recombinase family protein n=1 Tax=Hyphococcus sp. TaxID=2038636 RepID=UPI0035C731EA
MKIGYARVSTEEQNLDLQRRALNAAGCDLIFEDRGVSGSALTRVGLDKALAALTPGDTLITWRLDRLGRSMTHLISIVTNLKSLGCGFQSLTEAIDTETAGGRFYFHMLGALAEFERALIAERTRAGLQAARERGQRLGRPRKLSAAQIAHARDQIATGKHSLASLSSILGCDKSTLWRALR